jgi:hypothetical protein
LGQNVTIEEIELTLHDICAQTYLDPDVVLECEALIDSATPQLIQYLINNSDPAAVCTELSFCPD